MRITVDRLVLSPNIPAGMNPLVLMSLTYVHRATSEDHGGAVRVRPIAGTDLFRVIDGRHRFLACVIAGRPDVLCKIEEEN